MDTLLRLCMMLGAGLVARHAVLGVGRRIATRSTVHIPRLCSFATAGIVAALVREALVLGQVEPVLTSVLFGVVWGVAVGLLLPLSRRVDA